MLVSESAPVAIAGAKAIAGDRVDEQGNYWK
jgi:hypothetical protein